MSGRFARIEVKWLTAEQGGRSNPFVGGRYTPTARFAGASDDEQFSVVLQFDVADGPNPTNGSFELLFPDLLDIRTRIRSGTRLDIMEGRRKVADCLVLSAEPAGNEPVVR
jgi:hypothetical protein